MNEKKYVLAKDLPFAKKGDPIYNFESKTKISQNDLCYVQSLEEGGVCRFSGLHSIGYVSTLLRDGWIEEVKPQKPLEIWVNEFSIHNIATLGFAFTSEEKAKADLQFCNDFIRTIHFIEVED